MKEKPPWIFTEFQCAFIAVNKHSFCMASVTGNFFPDGNNPSSVRPSKRKGTTTLIRGFISRQNFTHTGPAKVREHERDIINCYNTKGFFYSADAVHAPIQIGLFVWAIPLQTACEAGASVLSADIIQLQRVLFGESVQSWDFLNSVSPVFIQLAPVMALEASPRCVDSHLVNLSPSRGYRLKEGHRKKVLESCSCS